MLMPCLNPFNSCSCGVKKKLTQSTRTHIWFLLNSPVLFSTILLLFSLLQPPPFLSILQKCHVPSCLWSLLSMERSNSPTFLLHLLLPPLPCQVSLPQGFLSCLESHINLPEKCISRTLCFFFTALLINAIQQLFV